MDRPASADVQDLADRVLRGPGEMAALMRAFDWSTTPLGPVEQWSASLRTTVSTLLASRHAMFLWWGPELIQFYNDGYRGSLGPDRHPSALGAPGRECWAEIWPIIGPEVESVLAGGESTWHADHHVPITRGDRVRDVFWSYSYSPVQDDDGSVGGVLVTVQETTTRVVNDRRSSVLQDLGAGMDGTWSTDDVCRAAADVLGTAAQDVAFAAIYLLDGESRLALRTAVRISRGSAAAPDWLSLQDDHPWLAREILAAGRGPRAAAVAPLPEPLVDDRWPEAITQALVVAIPSSDPRSPSRGLLVLGLNPRLEADERYQGFGVRVAGTIGAALDRTRRLERERSAAAAAATAERDLLTHVFELSPSFLAVLRGPDHVYELTNPAYHQLIGHRNVIGKPVAEALPEVADQGFVALLDRVYQTGEPFVGNEVEVMLRPRADEQPTAYYLNFVYRPMRAADGTVRGILATGVNVTALVQGRRIIERALAETERIATERDTERRQLLTVLEQSPLAIVVVEAPSGRVLFTNSKVSEIFGHVHPSEGVDSYGEQWTGFHLDGRPVAPEEWPISKALLHGAIVENETLEVVHVSGRRAHITLNAAPVRNESGDIIAAVAFFRDVTTERQTERQLRDAQRLKAVGTLAGGVAHEINNQMTAVLGFGEFVLRELGPAHPQAPDLRLVLQAGQRAARVSQQLLAFTRQQVTQRRVLDLQAEVREFEPVLAQLLGSDKTLRIECADGGAKVSADPEQVQQVLINLVANARDATDTGAEVEITIEDVTVERRIPAPLGEPVEPGAYVRVSIRDDGTGMSGDTLGRIFDPFFTTKAVGEGTGLGLPMVYGTMRRHDGYVLARSAPGEGTTVELYWPSVGVSDERGAIADEPPAEAPAGRGAVILVAEDEPMVRALTVRTLEEEGYRVVAGDNGVNALAALEGTGTVPDLVVTDVIMPRSNGRQLADAVRSRWPDVPVLFISGHTGEGDVLDRLVPPGSPFLQKPFTPGDLVRAVAALQRRA